LSGRKIKPKGRQSVPPRDSIRLELPGGGGFGDPHQRDAAQVAADVADGLITREAAERDYGVGLRADGSVDHSATARLRGAAAAE
jgi:N-methylhydantoinase B